MKTRIFITVLCAILTVGVYAQMGVGLRFGDPAGITLKKYMSDNALEFSIGRTAWWGYDYRDRFSDWDDWNNHDYLNHKAMSAIGIQLHYLFQQPVNIEGVQGLDWYYGFGGQARFISVRYEYRWKEYYGPDDDDYNWRYEDEVRTDLDFGVDGVIGTEYTFSEVPISVFLDITLFVEVFDNPFRFRGQGGIGARYNF